MNTVQIITYERDGTRALVLGSQVLSKRSAHYFALDATDCRIKRVCYRHVTVETVPESATQKAFLTAYANWLKAKRIIKSSQCQIVITAQDSYLHDGSSQTIYDNHIIDAGTSNWLDVVNKMAKRYRADMTRLAGQVQAELIINELAEAA